MNIFYEESGQFKVASVVQKNDSTYQVDTQHGKRTKVKANHVFVEFEIPLQDFLARVEAEAAEIDTDLLWEVCGEEEFSAGSIAEEYFGHPPSQIELAATLMALYAAPMYFYKKAKGVFKAAPEETLKQALAAIERKKQQEAQIEAWAEELQAGSLPASVAADLKQILHAPDKQSLTYKAFTKAAEALKISAYQLAKQTGGVTSVPQYLLDGFTVKHFPKGTALPPLEMPTYAELPAAEGVTAFSIDDESTTEIDDALSLQDLAGGGKRVGIHIAVPTLLMAADSPIQALVNERQSTVYYPGGKITMLPDNWIAAFSLDQGERPALSIYFDVDEQFQVASPNIRLERVQIGANLRIQQIESLFNRQSGLQAENGEQFAHHHDLCWFYQFALALQKQRNRYDADQPPQYDYGIEFDENGQVRISRRERGAPIDTLVSEMMILANSTWAKMLDDHGLPGLFRVQPTAGKVRMSTKSEAHIGMGVQHYGWFTSPLRRAADCINQQQLLGLISEHFEPRFTHNDSMLFAALRDFDTAYAAYADFQRQMEAYWSLVYLQQQGERELQAVLLKDDLVRIEGLPLLGRAVGIPIDIPPKTRLKLGITDLDADKQLLGLKYLNPVV